MRGSNHGRVRLLAAAVIAIGVFAHHAQAKQPAPRKAIGCETDEECQAYCEFKYPGQNVRGICTGFCRCLF